MPLPPGVTTRTYLGTIVGLDGMNATGVLEFRQPKPIYDAANNVVVGPQKPITATVTNGAFSVALPVSPWQYVVRIATDAIKDVYLLLVEAGASPLTFASTYLTAGSPDLADFYVLHATFNALAERVADLEETGGVSVPDATSTTKGALRLTGDLGGTADAPTVPGLAGKYVKPGSGIPSTDLTAAVQALLVLAGTAVQPGALATVATTGAYADLTGKPSIPDSYDDLTGTVPTSALPAIAVTEYLGAAANQAAMLALVGQLGDWCTRTDLGTTWIITGPNPAQLASWTALSYPAAPVTSVNGQAGAVTLAKGDIGLGNVSNLAPADLPVSTAAQTALDGKQAADADLTAIAGLAPADNDLLQRIAGAWTHRTPGQVKTSLGLNLVDNTSDANKPISSATQAALDGKVDESLIDAAGDLLIGSADNTLARLAKGSDGQVLTVAGGSVSWGDAPAGGGLQVDPTAARYGCIALTMHPHDVSWISPQYIALTSGRHYMYWLPLPDGTLVTGVRLPVQLAGSGAGELHFAIYQDDNTQLGLSGDVAAQFAGAIAQTWQDVPLTAADETTGSGIWITALSTMDTGPKVVFSNTDGTNPLAEWLLNPVSHLTALRREGVASLPATLVPGTATQYIDFAIGVY